MNIVCCRTFGPPQNLQRIEIEAPVPFADEVLIDVSAAGVGFVDGLMAQGLYQVKPPLPYYPGSEFAGVVAQIGSDVIGLTVGDRVLGIANNGAFADQLTITSHKLVKIPDNLSADVAAGFFINYATALYGLRDCGKLQRGEKILILGAAGGVGRQGVVSPPHVLVVLPHPRLEVRRARATRSERRIGAASAAASASAASSARASRRSSRGCVSCESSCTPPCFAARPHISHASSGM